MQNYQPVCISVLLCSADAHKQEVMLFEKMTCLEVKYSGREIESDVLIKKNEIV